MVGFTGLLVRVGAVAQNGSEGSGSTDATAKEVDPACEGHAFCQNNTTLRRRDYSSLTLWHGSGACLCGFGLMSRNGPATPAGSDGVSVREKSARRPKQSTNDVRQRQTQGSLSPCQHWHRGGFSLPCRDLDNRLL